MQTYRGADHSCAEADGSGRRGGKDVAGEQGASKHTTYAWKAKYHGLDANEAQRGAIAGRRELAAMRLVADLRLNVEPARLSVGLGEHGRVAKVREGQWCTRLILFYASLVACLLANDRHREKRYISPLERCS